MKRVVRGQLARPEYREICVDGATKRVGSAALDVAGADSVDVQLSGDHTTLWVSLNGRNLLRVGNIRGSITVNDDRLLLAEDSKL